MPRLKQTLYVARSQESAELFGQRHKGPHRIMTLTGLLESLAGGTAERLEPLVARYLLKSVAEGLALEHFAHLDKSQARRVREDSGEVRGEKSGAGAGGRGGHFA